MKVGKYFLSSLGGRFSTTSVVKVERKLLINSGIQQKKVGLAEIHHFASAHSWLCKKTQHLNRVQYGCIAAVSFLTNINVKFGLVVLLN